VFEEIDEIVGLSILEYEEFIDEVRALIDKVNKRRETWKRKKEAVDQMNEWQS
jgi:hypothetical protein